MAKKEKLQRLIDQVEQAEIRLAGLLSESDRERSGELSHWAPKEVLAHCAGWTRRMVENIHNCHKGDKPCNYDNYLELNDQDFENYRKLEWQEIWDRSVSVRKDLRALLDQLTEEELLSSDLVPSDQPRPTWQRIVGTGVEHTLIHLGIVFNEIGRIEESTRIQEGVTRQLIELSPEDRNWQGIVEYNLACQLALSGEKTRAIEELKEALNLNPSLLEWSKQDSDLDSLRQEPDYLAIYA